jgi:hypothetical protein
MGKPDAPTAPNPYQTAQAQTGTNVSTAIANAFLGNVNQQTPTGSLNYSPTGSYQWTDPVSGSVYNIPTFTATQQLTPAQQQLLDTNQVTQQTLAGTAFDQASRVSNLLNTPFNPTSGAPTAGDWRWIGDIGNPISQFSAGGPIQTSIGNYGQQQTTFDNSGLANASNIASTYGPSDPTAYAHEVQQALMGQINPQLDIQRANLQQQLADQGIRYGSAAYNNAMMPLAQQQNNAWLQAITGATGQEKTLMDIAAQQAGFQNAAQQQAYLQAQGRGQFANQAQAQQYQEMLGAAGFANAAQGQQFQQNAAQATFQNASLAQQLAQQQAEFNAAQAQRNQYMQEQYAMRNQPINEISALLGQSQVTPPSWINAPQSQIPTTDIAGILNNSFNQQLGLYQQQNQNYQALMGGILGLGAGALRGGVMSDERMKENISPMGSVLTTDDSDERKTLPIYQYSYKGDPTETRHVGPMAQDVEKVDPDAVSERRGIKYIKPDKVMGSILRAA